MVEDGIEEYEDALESRYAEEEAAEVAATLWAAFDDH
jgi:hypothetical protein